MSQDKNNHGQSNRLRDHSYDGIQEYDNSLPRWWVWLLNFTIIFAAGYLLYFHVGSGASLQRVLRDDLAAATKSAPEGGPNTTTAQAVDLRDPNLAASGKADFVTTCAPCHGEAGQGNIGPNLTDNYWLHGGSPESVLKSISDGVVDKGMPAWKPVLGQEKVSALAAFVLSIRGSNPPNPKAPQGNEEK